MAEAACCAQMLLFGTNPCNTDCWCNVLFIQKGNAKKESNWEKIGNQKGNIKRKCKKGIKKATKKGMPRGNLKRETIMIA